MVTAAARFADQTTAFAAVVCSVGIYHSARTAATGRNDDAIGQRSSACANVRRAAAFASILRRSAAATIKPTVSARTAYKDVELGAASHRKRREDATRKSRSIAARIRVDATAFGSNCDYGKLRCRLWNGKRLFFPRVVKRLGLFCFRR
jgi:hypothetical protein